MLDDTPDSGIVLFEKICDMRDGHFLRHGNDQTVQKEGETTLFSCPGNVNLVNATIIAGNPRYPTVKIAFVLEEVQVTPDLLGSIIGFAPGLTALGTGKRRTREEIDPDIKTLLVRLKLDAIDEPGILNVQGYLEEVSFNQESSERSGVTRLVKLAIRPTHISEEPDP